MSTLVHVDQLVKDFGNFRAVDGISFDVSKGEVLGFLGPNGAGKSTTMKMITGFLTPDAGLVRIADNDVQAAPMQTKRRVGYLPEGAPLYPDMTPVTLLEFVGSVRGMSKHERKTAIDQVIDRVQLGDVLHKTLDTLSKGYKRRVGLAQAILHDPDVLILDEPTDGLDPNQKHEVRELIQEMSTDKAIVLSTHILEEVEAVCTRNIVIANGRVVADGTPAELESRSEWFNAVSMRVPAGVVDAATLEQALQSASGVRQVEVTGRDGDEIEAVAFAQDGAHILDAVRGVIDSRGWRTSTLFVERGRLDDVFRDITGNPVAGERGERT